MDASAEKYLESILRVMENMGWLSVNEKPSIQTREIQPPAVIVENERPALLMQLSPQDNIIVENINNYGIQIRGLFNLNSPQEILQAQTATPETEVQEDQ